jgi:Cu/Ag efflux pump CusA
LETAFQGEVISQVLEGRNAFDLSIRIGSVGSAWAHATPAMVGETLVDTPGGAKIPLKALARIYEDRGPNMVMRENVQRRIVVMCNVAGRDLRGVVNDIQAAISQHLELPKGYYVEYGGQFETAEETTRLLGLLGVVIIAAIGFLLHVAFRSMRDALLIMVNLPLALIGGVLGVLVSGGVLSVASMIGFITVFGIAARNGIMMVSHIRHLQRFEGVSDFREAVRRGAMERLAPILMTALAAGLALIPLAVSAEKPGNEILRPMAIVILFGLLSSTLLNMAVVPALFVRFGKPVAAEPVADIQAEMLNASHALPAVPA